MLVDSGVATADLSRVASGAVRLEEIGFDGLQTAETNHDPFLASLVAAEHTSRIDIATAIAVAFARSPMTVASTAHDIQQFCGGRFILGLGSQVKPHITKRFSMPWSSPAARMREYVMALRAIWACWNDGEKLDFRGDFYQHTLMTPFFDPGPTGFGPPEVFVAAVGPRMTEVAGEVADGVIVHGFTTERYLREVTLPAIERGLTSAGRSRDDFQISGPLFVVTGRTEEELAQAGVAVRRQIAFYGSTPAYRGVLELHGWADLQTELNSLSKQGRWADMGDLVDTEILETFAVVAEPRDVGKALVERYGDVVDRCSFYAPYESDPSSWQGVIDDLRAT